MQAGILFAAESLRAGNGGIARLARLVARVLGEEVAAKRMNARALALSDPEPVNEFGLPVEAAGGSRMRSP